MNEEVFLKNYTMLTLEERAHWRQGELLKPTLGWYQQKGVNWIEEFPERGQHRTRVYRVISCVGRLDKLIRHHLLMIFLPSNFCRSANHAHKKSDACA